MSASLVALASPESLLPQRVSVGAGVPSVVLVGVDWFFPSHKSSQNVVAQLFHAFVSWVFLTFDYLIYGNKSR